MLYYFFNIIKKKLIKGLVSNGGRNKKGRICIRGRSRGNKNIYRYIDFYKRINQFGKLLHFFYDTNRSAKIVLILYNNGLCCYSILQKNIKINTYIYSGTSFNYNKIKLTNGFSLPLKLMPLFSILSNIELLPFQGSKLVRAAGLSSILISKDTKNSFLKLNSGWTYKLNNLCISTLGANSSRLYNNEIIRKGGKNRGLGFKSKVRGVAKNPCDHPHGGGNGKRSKPCLPVNAWNSVFKWKSTKSKIYYKLKKRKFKSM